jgi:hypothetical protein
MATTFKIQFKNIETWSLESKTLAMWALPQKQKKGADSKHIGYIVFPDPFTLDLSTFVLRINVGYMVKSQPKAHLNTINKVKCWSSSFILTWIEVYGKCLDTHC